ncbi:MAG: NAD(P)/FAD-dependent oxidoreductase [Xanthomonadales bacterium]|nr:NAD(P)/FAD-dependent oxidoreductase [Xanthomonadales bacterium]
MLESGNHYDVAIVGAGFTGLAAALDLAKSGKKVVVLERDAAPGGLAGTFEFNDGVRIEKFYHHWFNNDEFVPQLVNELGLSGEMLTLASKTGMYYNGKQWRLSTPWDLIRFTPLSLVSRIRLGLLVFRVRQVKDWRSIENLSIREWLEPLCGAEAFRVVWEPLIRAKFSIYADQVSAVWFWKKLVLRGSTRDSKGGEQLAYFKGGFGRLAEAMVDAIRRDGGEVLYGQRVTGIDVDGKKISRLNSTGGEYAANEYLFTPAFPVIADLFRNHVNTTVLERWQRVNYLGNMCLVLELDRSLSDTYWLNVNDPGFPFVGVIEHTNFDLPENYKHKRVVYLSRYLPVEDPLWGYSDAQYLEFATGHIKRMFPAFETSWVLDYRIWRAEFAQPITERGYSEYLPGPETPFCNATISTMAHIYPEDRGTNYAIREGRIAAKRIQQCLR